MHVQETKEKTQLGLKARIEKLLIDRKGESLTLGQISAALDLPKTAHAEISSCLSKPHCDGRVSVLAVDEQSVVVVPRVKPRYVKANGRPLGRGVNALPPQNRVNLLFTTFELSCGL